MSKYIELYTELPTSILAKSSQELFAIVENQQHIRFQITYVKKKYYLDVYPIKGTFDKIKKNNNGTLNILNLTKYPQYDTKELLIEAITLVLQKLHFKEKNILEVTPLDIENPSILSSLESIFTQLGTDLIGEPLKLLATSIVDTLGIIKEYYDTAIIVTQEYIQRYGPNLRYKVGELLETIALRNGTALAFFGGEKARLAPLDLLNLAKISTAKSSQKNWEETGWIKGMDWKWRFEISDNEARIKENIPTYKIKTLGDLLICENLYKHYPQARDILIEFSGQYEIGYVSSSPSGTAVIENNVITLHKRNLYERIPFPNEIEEYVKETGCTYNDASQELPRREPYELNGKVYKSRIIEPTEEGLKDVAEFMKKYEKWLETRKPTESELRAQVRMKEKQEEMIAKGHDITQPEFSYLFDLEYEENLWEVTKIPGWLIGKEDEPELDEEVFELIYKKRICKKEDGTPALIDCLTGKMKDRYILRDTADCIDKGDGRIIKKMNLYELMKDTKNPLDWGQYKELKQRGESTRDVLVHSWKGTPIKWRYTQNKDLISVVLHEVQHFIQAIEGFENGGSGSTFAEIITKRGKELGIEMEAQAKIMGSKFYYQLEGEVEARNVEKRREFTPEERKKIIPRKTEDKKRSEQLNHKQINKRIKNMVDFVKSKENT